jgi:hypothetical protein
MPKTKSELTFQTQLSILLGCESGFFFLFFLSALFCYHKMSDLPSLRKKIDSLDTSLINLLNERMRVSLDIGTTKRQQEELKHG